MAFDIDRFTAESDALDWQDLDFTVFRVDPLPEGTLRCLRYMCEVEFHTVCYLRDLLVTPSHKERDVAAFMTMWNREEFWHGEALAAVLGMHGITVDFDELKAERIKLGWKEKLTPVKQSILGNLIGQDFVAVHMTWGAANEWSAAAAYRRLAMLEPHPVLSPLLQRIAQQESRHIAFYASQARDRLERSRKAQKLTRFALETAWQPVGSSIQEPQEVTHVMKHIFGGPEGMEEVRKIDANLAKMPGLEGLTIFENALRAHGMAA